MLRAMYRTFEIIGLSTSWLIRYDVSLVISAKLNNIHFTYIVNLDSIYIYIYYWGRVEKNSLFLVSTLLLLRNF